MGPLPKQYGGGVSNLDLQIVAEEITAVDPGFATGLMEGIGTLTSTEALATADGSDATGRTTAKLRPPRGV